MLLLCSCIYNEERACREVDIYSKNDGETDAAVVGGNDLLPRKLINGSQPYRFTLLFMNIYYNELPPQLLLRILLVRMG